MVLWDKQKKLKSWGNRISGGSLLRILAFSSLASPVKGLGIIGFERVLNSSGILTRLRPTVVVLVEVAAGIGLGVAIYGLVFGGKFPYVGFNLISIF